MSLHGTFVSMGFPSQDVAEILEETSHYTTALEMLVSKRNRRTHSASDIDGLLPDEARNILHSQNELVDSSENQVEINQIGGLTELNPQDPPEFTVQNDHQPPLLRPISPDHQTIAEASNFALSNQREDTAAMGTNRPFSYIPNSQEVATNSFSHEVDELNYPSSSQQVLNSYENYPQPPSSCCQLCISEGLDISENEHENRKNSTNLQPSNQRPLTLSAISNSVLGFIPDSQGYSLERVEAQPADKIPNPFERTSAQPERNQNPFENSAHFPIQNSVPHLENSDSGRKQANPINLPNLIPNTHSLFSQPPDCPNPETFDSKHKNQSQHPPSQSLHCIENTFKPFGQPPNLNSFVPDPPSAPLPPMSQFPNINTVHSLNSLNLPRLNKLPILPNLLSPQTASDSFSNPPVPTVSNPPNLPTLQAAPNSFGLPTLQTAPNPFGLPSLQAAPNPLSIPPRIPTIAPNPPSLQTTPNPFNHPAPIANPFNPPPARTAPNPFDQPSDSTSNLTCQVHEIPLPENSAEEPSSPSDRSISHPFNSFANPPNHASNPPNVYYPNLPQASISTLNQSLNLPSRATRLGNQPSANRFGGPVLPGDIPRAPQLGLNPYPNFSRCDRSTNVQLPEDQSSVQFGQPNELPSNQRRHSGRFRDECNTIPRHSNALLNSGIYGCNDGAHQSDRSVDPSFNSFSNPPLLQTRVPNIPRPPPLPSDFERPIRPRFPPQAAFQDDSLSSNELDHMDEEERYVFRMFHDQRRDFREYLDSFQLEMELMEFSDEWRHIAGMPATAIDQIRTELYTEGITKHIECAVCLDVFKEKQSIKILQCGHPYHTECIVKWLRAKSQCPLCRKRL